MEMATHMMDEDMDKSKELLNSAKRMARDGLLSIRRVVETLRVEETIGKTNSIGELIDEFSIAAGIEIEFKIIGEHVSTNRDIDTTLYRIVQEALTNSVRHGKASKVKVEIRYNKYIEFYIKDNGIGTESIKEGYGLRGMKERIGSLNGKVEFESKNGFIVKGYLPK
jgi:signal transduction histidine kinase